MRRSIQRQSQDDQLFLLGPVPLHGFRPAYLSIKLERYPGLPAGNSVSPLSLGDPGEGRGYLDFASLYKIHQTSAFFVTRAKVNFSRTRLYSNPVDKSTGVQCDQIVVLKGHYAKKDYPEKLRRIRYFDSKNNKTFVFLTNNFVLAAITIAGLYRCRWQVELFFKWIKQHLRIKAFYGTTENAVKTQVWIAISIYVLVAIVKKTLKLDQSLYTILQILSVTLFEKTPVYQAFSNVIYTNQEDCPSN
jgi:hypothetical protein